MILIAGGGTFTDSAAGFPLPGIRPPIMVQLAPHLFNGLTLGLLFALIALGFTLIVGVMEVLNLAHGSLFASPPWLGALRDTYGLEPRGWLAYSPDDEIVGGLPLVTLGEGAWKRNCSLPFSDYSNPIDVDGTAWPLFAAQLAGTELPVELRCLGDVAPVTDAGLATAGPPDLWHGIALDIDEERAWAGLDGLFERRRVA